MNNKNNILLGDRVLWVALGLLSIFSFLPVFSASSNLSYVVGHGTPWGHLLKHFIVLLFGFGLIYILHKIPYNYFRGFSIWRSRLKCCSLFIKKERLRFDRFIYEELA